ncbi:MAG: glucose-6-phosphate isomerase [Chitinophagaceae bacterium]|nr:glucose-6-phosphate isomerase [Chitinophagaceae bacterium]
MLANIDPTTTDAWKKLAAHAKTMQKTNLSSLFKNDTNRFSTFSVQLDNLLFDYSKNIITEETKGLLLQLANDCKLPEAINSMFNGEKINATEGRAVLHTALRNQSGQPVYCEGKDVMPDVQEVLAQMKTFSQNIHTGQAKGYTGKKIKYIVNIGIGGSDLGPRMVTEALQPYRIKEIETHFVSNIDGADIKSVLAKVNAEETLFLIASKTFTTDETMTNAHTARSWFLETAKDEKHIALHFVALSTNTRLAIQFGIAEENIFGFWDWVGGRFSLWSAIGLSIALAIGYENFETLLKGAYTADLHFQQTDFEKNIPVLMALLSIWYVNFFDAKSEAVLPYAQYLHRLPAYLQQAAMESNGKRIDRNGQPVQYATCPVIWGEPGTNSQHSFFQLLHQGTPFIPCDFIAFAKDIFQTGEHHEKLLSNFFAQTEALAFGKNEDAVKNELKNKGLTEKEISQLLPFKIFPGNKPTNSILLKELTPFTVGTLLALYEHKIFVQGVIWNIYSFDQWGVELGKELAQKILLELRSQTPSTEHDGSTNGLINYWKEINS